MVLTADEPVSMPDAANAKGVQLDVAVDLRDMELQPNADHWIGSFDLGFGLDGAKPPAPAIRTVEINLTEDQFKVALASGLVVGTTFPSPAQSTRVRVVVLDRNSGAAGSLRLSVTPR